MKSFIKMLILFLTGGMIYYAIEILYRGYSHPAMIIVGGICFVVCGLLNEIYSWEMPIQEQMLISGIFITIIELVAGLVLNKWLGLAIWDYSNMPLNFMGQICLSFSVLWCFLSAVGIILDDFLRYFLFGEEKPHYCFGWE